MVSDAILYILYALYNGIRQNYTGYNLTFQVQMKARLKKTEPCIAAFLLRCCLLFLL